MIAQAPDSNSKTNFAQKSICSVGFFIQLSLYFFDRYDRERAPSPYSRQQKSRRRRGLRVRLKNPHKILKHRIFFRNINLYPISIDADDERKFRFKNDSRYLKSDATMRGCKCGGDI
ncbi:hypothetical protein [Aerobium aerolatum]|uniref:hypothetical protein n=1 Tax=Aerobium aerolatum TaxID=561088 RepID=UPI001AECB6F6|nr:hypothetical protein [Aquamicrobium aerolatum]